ncbi:unnamed protein product, partial [Gongylonema pulchrum]|uniref:Ribonuclease R n=1 Tax=Gongylonema pulchrum TaxID=637853 RepID=A0A183DA86_9BILA
NIAPFETKTVINTKLLGAQERNATAYVKIKADWTRRREEGSTQQRPAIAAVAESVNETTGNDSDGGVEHVEETLIVPVEAEIVRKRGLFAAVDILDFGLVRAGDKSRELLLQIVSNLEKTIEIE